MADDCESVDSNDTGGVLDVFEAEPVDLGVGIKEHCTLYSLAGGTWVEVRVLTYPDVHRIKVTCTVVSDEEVRHLIEGASTEEEGDEGSGEEVLHEGGDSD